ncbi:MAG: protein kinase [Candidatus Schekmanbacteria bacterium]|nr:protein kinase [Candidatus Schekmanbacteria bacterium]
MPQYPPPPYGLPSPPPAVSGLAPLRVADSFADLALAERTVVPFGRAPDGLPWLLEVNRSDRMAQLRHAVVAAFELDRWERLPEGVRQAVDTQVAAGLLGIHELSAQPAGAPRKRVYVSRRPVRELLGATVLTEALFSTSEAATRPTGSALPITAVAAAVAAAGADEVADRLERAIQARRASRHLVLHLAEQSCSTATVLAEDAVLRRPQEPVRAALFETLRALPGCTLQVTSGDGQTTRVGVDDGEGYGWALLRGGGLYDKKVAAAVTRAAVLGLLSGLGQAAGALHRQGIVHGDLTPANCLLEASGIVPFDSLALATGDIATAATFEWAAPEQIISRPVSPQTDVFALGRMLARLLGAVPFGELATYVVPTGGGSLSQVPVVKTAGVFIDVTGTGRSRSWQRAWQGLLLDCLAFDPESRPADGQTFADRVADVAAAHPIDGAIEINPAVGRLVAIEPTRGMGVGRLLVD